MNKWQFKVKVTFQETFLLSQKKPTERSKRTQRRRDPCEYCNIISRFSLHSGYRKNSDQTLFLLCSYKKTNIWTLLVSHQRYKSELINTHTHLLINKCSSFKNNTRYHKLKYSRWKIQITENLRWLKRDNH